MQASYTELLVLHFDECLPDLGEGASMVTDTHYNFCTPDEKGGDYCQ